MRNYVQACFQAAAVAGLALALTPAGLAWADTPPAASPEPAAQSEPAAAAPTSTPTTAKASAAKDTGTAAAPDAATPSGSQKDSQAATPSKPSSSTAGSSGSKANTSSAEDPVYAKPSRTFEKDGWLVQDGQRFYVQDDKLVKGQQPIKGHWYYFDETTGAAKTGFVHIPEQNKWVYYNERGQMLYGQQAIKGHWYNFDRITGARSTGFVYIPEQRKWVYYNKQGQMLYGQQAINGNWYYLNKHTGAVTYGFLYIPEQNKWVFYDRVLGTMQYGEKPIDGAWYLLNPVTGAVSYGWQNLPGKRVFYDRVTGRMTYGWAVVDGKNRFFDPVTGALSQADPHARSLAQGMSSATQYLILVDLAACRTHIFQGHQGAWEDVVSWSCSPGAPATPTPRGHYTIGMRGFSFGNGFTCYYWTQFLGDYLFHSQIYYQGTYRILENVMGVPASHGCVRLYLDNARWIYENIPSGTHVFIY